MRFHASGVPRLVVDVETYGTLDLARAGAHAYAWHPDTDVHCLAWLLKDGMGPDVAGLWRPGDKVPTPIRAHLAAEFPVVAHNFLFELNVWAAVLVGKHGFPPVADHAWSCTMARALYHGFPASLDLLSEALPLTHAKDKGGRANMLALAKPRRVDAGGRPVWWKDDPATGQARLDKLYAYCVQDTLAESEADDKLPELPASERAVFQLDAAINQRGVALDPELIDALDLMTGEEQVRLSAAMARITRGAVSNASRVAALSQWLAEQGVLVSSLDKEGVAFALAAEPPGPARDALLIRREAARASTAKLRSMRAAVSADGRARGMFQYYGAARTGRWAGRRAQFQNYPRGTLPPGLVDKAIGWALAGHGAPAFEALLPGTPMGAIASCLRGCLVAGPGRKLVAADLAQIEARVIAWLAGQSDMLAVFAKGQDVYTYTALKIGSDSRMLGKILTLACGFGMGWARFQETAAGYGLVLDDATARGSVGAWRQTNGKIVAFWYALDDAFRRCVAGSSGYAESVGIIMLRRVGGAVRVRLPSGRELFYQQVAMAPDSDGGRESITYMGVHQTTRRWERIRTYGGKLAENITQAVARDVMAHALVTLAGDRVPAVGSIHDEGIFEVLDALAQGTLAHVLRVFRTPPPWAPGLPVGAEGWVGDRYRKG